MGANSILISVLVGLSLFLIILAIATIHYDNKIKGTRYARRHPNDWLFSDFDDQVYQAFFKDKNSDDVAKKIGLNLEEYEKSCAICQETPNTKKIDVYFLYGMFSLLVTAILALATKAYALLLIGVIGFFYFVYYQQHKERQKAQRMRDEIANELPRFLDLLQAELDVGLPIEIAIRKLAERMDTLLAREFLASLNDVQLGSSGWQEALEDLAAKYDVETLTDFVLNVNTAYSRGVDIADVVTRKTKDIKDSHVLGVKERAGKATNTILLPITIFQIVPMIAFLMIPALGTVMNGL